MRGIGAQAFLTSESSQGPGIESKRIAPEKMVKMVGIPAAPARGGSRLTAARSSAISGLPSTYLLRAR